MPVHVNIEEVRKPELDAQLIADSIAQQLQKRIMFRRAMKRAITNAMRLGAQGIKIMSAGRLNGIEIARTEWYREGRVPLHTMRAEIDYGDFGSEDQLRRHRHQGVGVQGRSHAEERSAGGRRGGRPRRACRADARLAGCPGPGAPGDKLKKPRRAPARPRAGAGSGAKNAATRKA